MAVASPEAAVAGADIVLLATSSLTPVIRATWTVLLTPWFLGSGRRICTS
jgi:ornithine cyclodeaminase/alanine dehydrogenase-like protein (mu-crystallin family)